MVQLTELASDPSAVKKLSTEELRAEVERLRSLAAAVQAGATQEARKQQPKSVRNRSSDSAPAADLDEVPEEEEAPAGRVSEYPPFVRDEVTDQKLTYTNGDVYEGQVLNGTQRHGRGVHTCSSGDSYDGEWRNDQRHGSGVAVFANGLEYKGAWKHDKADGDGSCVYPSGDEYTGEWKNDHRWGWGRYTMASGDTYEGQWHDDVIHGKGRYTHADGAIYEGEYVQGQRVQGRYASADGKLEYVGAWLDGMRHGKGIQHSSGLFKYSGQWLRDVRQGHGTCVYHDGTTYEGDWKDDEQHGRGVYTSSNGDTYDGEWADNLMHGQGTMRYANGDVYIGTWLAGKRHGQGVLKGADGSGYDGEWEEDCRHGVGAARLADGCAYQGEWSRNVRHGTGVCVFADGRKFRGAWDSGVWVQSTADPLLSKLRGTGLARAIAGCAASFSIIARDEERNTRLTGGDTWRLWLAPGRVRDGDADQDRDDVRLMRPAGADCVHGTVTDNSNGTYTATYVCTVAGAYTLYVTTGEGEPVDDCPYPVRVLAAEPCRRKSLIEGDGRRMATAGEPQSFIVAGRDVYGNACGGQLLDVMPVEVTITAASGASVTPHVEDSGKGAYVVTYTAPWAGLYRLEVTSGGKPVGDSPLSISVAPGGDDETSDTPEQLTTPQGDQPVVPDLVRRWADIAAQEFVAVDGIASGFDSDDDVKETPEQRFERENPDVPVVRNLEDMWMVTKMQQEQKKRDAIAAWQAERARKAEMEQPRDGEAAVAHEGAMQQTQSDTHTE